ncbi:hypothetical protein BHM03_00036427 [Ensete ventricosum]|nr:hypothetical protein BHM03_00036427 [Ensete ventricosum]
MQRSFCGEGDDDNDAAYRRHHPSWGVLEGLGRSIGSHCRQHLSIPPLQPSPVSLSKGRDFIGERGGDEIDIQHEKEGISANIPAARAARALKRAIQVKHIDNLVVGSVRRTQLRIRQHGKHPAANTAAGDGRELTVGGLGSLVRVPPPVDGCPVVVTNAAP